MRFSDDDEAPAPKKRRGNPNWVKGQHKKIGGRQKGTPNATTKFLKDAIQEAMELAGADGRGTGGAAGYLAWVARKHPAIFGRILEKLLPFTINNQGGTPMTMQYVDKTEIRVQFKERGLPIPSLLEPPKYNKPLDDDESDIIDVEAEEVDQLDQEE